MDADYVSVVFKHQGLIDISVLSLLLVCIEFLRQVSNVNCQAPASSF
jgi:hypothetical protein